MDVLLVVAHPRQSSLTHAAAGALAEGLHEAGLAKRGYREAIRISLQVGILDYCGMKDGRLALLTGSLDGPERQRALVLEARQLGRDWPAREQAQGSQE
jgi:NAD(P)H dehydrogenase (quinone)